MKINFQNFAYLLFAGLLGLTSCGGSDEETPAPTITISTNSLGSDQTKGTSVSGDTVDFSLAVAASEEIKSLTITKSVGASETTLPTYPKTSGFTSKTAHVWVASYKVAETSGTVTLKFSVEDKKGKIASKSFVITVSSTDPINMYTTVLLNNSFSATQSSFFNARTGAVYSSLADAKTNSGTVDFIHLLRNSASGGRQIAAPNSANAAAIYGADLTNTNNITSWGTRNPTKFKSVTWTDAQFAGVTTGAGLGTAAGAASDMTADFIGSLSVGSGFSFVLANGKRGIARVTAVTGNADYISSPGADNSGSVTLTVKTEI